MTESQAEARRPRREEFQGRAIRECLCALAALREELSPGERSFVTNVKLKVSFSETTMPYSESLADRIRTVLARRRGIVEKKMFGGLIFMLDGNMLVGVWHSSLIARVGPEQAEAGLRQSHVARFDVTGRPMKGWLLIDPDGLESDAQLQTWIEQADRFVSGLPKK